MTENSKPDIMWKQRDGSLIAIKNMTESHAKNVLQMLLRNMREKEAFVLSVLDIINQEREERGALSHAQELAMDAVTREHFNDEHKYGNN